MAGRAQEWLQTASATKKKSLLFGSDKQNW